MAHTKNLAAMVAEIQESHSECATYLLHGDTLNLFLTVRADGILMVFDEFNHAGILRTVFAQRNYTNQLEL